MGSLAFLRNRVRFARLRSFAALPLRLNCSRVVVVTLAGPRCWRFSPTPTATEVRLIRSPSPCSKERCSITVTDSRGLSPHSSNLERLVTLPRTRRLSSIFGCVGYSMASSQGGGQALCGDSAPFVTPPALLAALRNLLRASYRAFLDERRIPSTCGAPWQDRAPVPLLTNHPAFCQQFSTPNAKGRFWGQAPSIAEQP